LQWFRANEVVLLHPVVQTVDVVVVDGVGDLWSAFTQADVFPVTYFARIRADKFRHVDEVPHVAIKEGLSDHSKQHACANHDLVCAAAAPFRGKQDSLIFFLKSQRFLGFA